MLATIDDITAAKVDRDRKDHGAGYLRVLLDGRVEHVPIERVDHRVDVPSTEPPIVWRGIAITNGSGITRAK